MTVSLLTPILENGILNTNFFQGRVLTADDLQTEQKANRAHRRHLGRAIGPGIIEGLQVSIVSAGTATTPPALKVASGLALNGEGQDLKLAEEETIVLGSTSKPKEPEAGLFAPCSSSAPEFVGSGNGVYVLVMCPVSGFRQRAPMSGFDCNGKAIGCGSRYAVEGVQFRLEFFDPKSVSGLSANTGKLLDELTGMKPLDTAEIDRLSGYRNLLAHISFGSEQMDDFLIKAINKLFSQADTSQDTSAEYGVLDHLNLHDRISDSDVPLALFYWSVVDGLLFLDVWDVRRQVAFDLKLGPSFLPTNRRLAEAQARLAQFQTHLQFLLDQPTVRTSFKLQDYFHFLPPVGFLPLADAEMGTQGFLQASFFQAWEFGDPMPIDISQVAKLLADSLHYGPVELSEDSFVEFYRVTADSGVVQPFLVFVAAHIPLDIRASPL